MTQPMKRRIRNLLISFFLMGIAWVPFAPGRAVAATLRAGAAKVDITNREAGPVDGPLHARALVLELGDRTVVLITVDAVAIGEIGYINKEYLPKVRARLKEELHIAPENVIVNASHCHGIVCSDVDERTVEAVRHAASRLVPVRIGVGVGHEDRIMENRRLKLKDGTEADVRHAYSLPPDAEVSEVGPVDPQIGILRLDDEQGETVAVVYNFACHPIQGVPSGANTADITGFSSQVIEDNLSEKTVALFVQGCGGDINPITYKAVDFPRDAEPLGNMLGLSTLKALRGIECTHDDRLKIINRSLELPRRDAAQRIIELEAERDRLLDGLQGTSLNLKTFIPLIVKYQVNEDFPSSFSHQYMLEKMLGREDLSHLDAANRKNMESYVKNIHTMEELTRVQTNLRLLKLHQEQNLAAGKRTLDVEMVAMRVGGFVLTTFPGELTVRIGLRIKKDSPLKNTFVAGYSNGYIYYCPTAEQLANWGRAQEDSDCLLAPEWQEIYETSVLKLLAELGE